jgi:acyl-homoserine-lactone acylase
MARSAMSSFGFPINPRLLRSAPRLLRSAIAALVCSTLLACNGGSGLGGDDTVIPPGSSTPDATPPPSTTPPGTTPPSTTPEPEPEVLQPGEYRRYDVSIKRTQYGVPHVTASDWGSLGFGYGYAFAQDNYCTLLREIIAARGESARWFGATQGNVDADFIYALLNGDDEKMQREWIDVQPAHVQQLVTGYADGLNQYVDDTGIANLPQDCRNAPWVSTITNVDMVKFLRKLAQQGSADNESVRSMIMAVQGPTLPVAPAAEFTDDEAEMVRESLKRLGKPIMDISTHGSNAYALG